MFRPRSFRLILSSSVICCLTDKLFRFLITTEIHKKDDVFHVSCFGFHELFATFVC